MKEAYLVVDIGTGNTRVSAVTPEGDVLAISTQNSEYYRDTDFKNSVCFRPERWKEVIFGLIRKVLAELSDIRIIGISSSSQRQGIVLIDYDGKEIVGYQNSDQRGAQFLKEINWEPIKKVTGLDPKAMFSCVKIYGTKKVQPEVLERTKVYTSISEWVGYALTGNAVWEHSQAMHTAVYDPVNKCWSQECCDVLGIDINQLAPLAEAGSVIGNVKKEIAEELGIGEDVPFIVGAADTQIALEGVDAKLNDIVVVSGTTTPVVEVVDEFKYYPCWISTCADSSKYMLEVNASNTGINLQTFKEEFFPNDDYQDLERKGVERGLPKLWSCFSGCPHLAVKMNLTGGFVMSSTFSGEIRKEDFYYAMVLDIAFTIVTCERRLEELHPENNGYIIGCGGGFRGNVTGQVVANLTGKEVRLLKGYDQATSMGCVNLCNKALNKPVIDVTPVRVFTPEKDEALERYFTKWQKVREGMQFMQSVQF